MGGLKRERKFLLGVNASKTRDQEPGDQQRERSKGAKRESPAWSAAGDPAPGVRGVIA